MYPTNPKSHAFYRKALELRDVTRQLAAYVSFNQDASDSYSLSSHRTVIASSLLEDALLIPIQIEEAEKANSHDLRLNSAKYVSIMTKNILSYCNGLERDGMKEKEYLNLLRSEIKSFRKSFKVWRRSLLRGGEMGSWGMDSVWNN